MKIRQLTAEIISCFTFCGYAVGQFFFDLKESVKGLGRFIGIKHRKR